MATLRKLKKDNPEEKAAPTSLSLPTHVLALLETIVDLTGHTKTDVVENLIRKEGAVLKLCPPPEGLRKKKGAAKRAAAIRAAAKETLASEESPEGEG